MIFLKIGILSGNPSNALDIKRQVEQFGKAKQTKQPKICYFFKEEKNILKLIGPLRDTVYSERVRPSNIKMFDILFSPRMVQNVL